MALAFSSFICEDLILIDDKVCYPHEVKFGIIDLGTNSVRFDIYSSVAHGKPRLIHREKLMIRLGQDVFVTGRIEPEAIERAVFAFRHFQKIAKVTHTQRILAFGTAALREAINRDQFIRTIKQKSKIEIKMLSGQEEAKLIAKGILANEKTLGKEKFFLVDIGGGSTELSYVCDRKVKHSESLPLGSARLQQLFLKRSPPKPRDIDRMRNYIREILNQSHATQFASASTIIFGSSGTIKSLGRLIDEDEEYSRSELSALVKRMLPLNTSQLLDLAKMEPKRVDMILAGAILLEEISIHFLSKRIKVSEFSLRDGILEEENSIRSSKEHSWIALHLNDVLKHASRYGQSAANLEKVKISSAQFYRRMAAAFGMRSDLTAYFVAAALLRNIGEYISYPEHDLHTAYLIRAMELSGLEVWEKELLANLCRYHGGGKIRKEDLDFTSAKPLLQRDFMRLLSLLQVFDCLDYGTKSDFSIRSVRRTRGLLTISYNSPSSTEMENVFLQRFREQFRQVFHCELKIQRKT